MKKFILVAFFSLILSGPLYALDYKVDHANSKIEFSGKYMDAPFIGTFSKWGADIKFDPNDLTGSSIKVTIEASSINTNDPQRDASLLTADWFDTKKNPKVIYTSKAISKNSDGSYAATGTLMVKEKPVDINFNFILTPADLKTPPIKATFSMVLDRIAMGLGVTSDPKGDYASREINLNVVLLASPK